MDSKLEKTMGKVPLENVVQEYVGELQLRNLSSRTVRLYAYTLHRLMAHLRRGQPEDAAAPFAALTSAESLQSIARWSVSSQLKNAHSCARDGGERWVVRQELMGRKLLESVNCAPGLATFCAGCAKTRNGRCDSP